MNTKEPLLFILCFLPLISNPTLAQSRYQIGGLPSINFNYKLAKYWSINYKVESRQLLEQGIFNVINDKKYKYILTDNSVLLAKKVGLNARIAGGYLLRFSEGGSTHRLIQQYAVTQKLSGFRLAHRAVADQTFSSTETTTFRIRYRLATEIPLNGESADLKELYFKISNEYLNSIQNSVYDIEIRLAPLFGYSISTIHKIEAGVDYRISSFVNQSAQHSFWTCLNWYIEI
ncbi:DUF2490 domain-containing protein [Chondrinema litorale]|uniref:DUF2490 domain-containing protein n=1 Tax=Chondrinema litorale TaxID=2994555 RepID=UPI002543ED83|nr:DUF2490 domain-containing protein [Chondrinema litorale]UZR99600.1 DUF2490 domain-containing protein [Chondrinema litorale]